MPKIAVVGKGGVGKTMISSCIAYLCAAKQQNVYAIDADPNPTLGQALGFPPDIMNTIRPILSLKEIIKERVGSDSDSFGTYFRLNPSVEDIPESFSALHRSIRLLIMGATRGTNTGCACAENVLLKTLMNHLVLKTKETVIMDMVAGTEHLGRGTAEKVDAMILVTEPTMRSIDAGKSILNLISQIKTAKRFILINKVRDKTDIDLVEKNFKGEDIAGYVDWNIKVLDAERWGIPVYDHVPDVVDQLNSVLMKIIGVNN